MVDCKYILYGFNVVAQRRHNRSLKCKLLAAFNPINVISKLTARCILSRGEFIRAKCTTLKIRCVQTTAPRRQVGFFTETGGATIATWSYPHNMQNNTVSTSIVTKWWYAHRILTVDIRASWLFILVLIYCGCLFMVGWGELLVKSVS